MVLNGGLGPGTRNLQSKRGTWSVTGELRCSLAYADSYDRDLDIRQW